MNTCNEPTENRSPKFDQVNEGKGKIKPKEILI